MAEANTPDTDKVAVLEAKVTGAIFVAPANVSLPTDATSALDPAYKCVGFSSDEGISITEDSSKETVRAWEGRKVVRNVINEYTEQVAFTPIECNERVAKLTWGDDAVDVDEKGNLVIRHHGRSMEPVNMVIEAVPYVGAVDRMCAKVQLTERGDVSGNGTDPMGRELTLDCLADERGTTLTEYIAITVEEGEPEVQSAAPARSAAKSTTKQEA